MERAGIYKIEDVLPYVVLKTEFEIRQLRKEDKSYGLKEYDGKMVSMFSQRYKLFATKGLICVTCGVVGQYFALERSSDKDKSYHFNLYGIGKDGKEVLFTKDHKVPKSDGGKNQLDNYQVMCFICNNKKGSDFDKDVKKKEELNKLKEKQKKLHNKKGIEWRMKEYELPYKMVLTKRLPVILRVDGRSFHQFLRLSDKPLDNKVKAAMDNVAVKLVENIQGAVFAYVQSDEVSVLIINYKTLDYDPWFNNELQKMVSVSASIATWAFNEKWKELNPGNENNAMFDSRVAVLPKEEVCNYFTWRQTDWHKNSIQMMARSKFSPRLLYRKNGSDMQEMLFKIGINWNDLPIWQKRGRCVYKETYEKEGDVLHSSAVRTRIKVDDEIPVFTQNRNFVEKFVFIEAESNKEG